VAIAFAAVVVFSSIAATLSAFAYLPAVAVVETLSPRRASARAATWLCALGIPVAGGIAAAVTGLHSVLCDAYASPHLFSDRPHLCSRWLSAAPDARFVTTVVGGVCAVMLGFALARLVFGVTKSEIISSRLRRSLPQGANVTMVDSPSPLVATVGVLRPVIVVTGGTADLLTADELKAVLAHEMAHLRRKDNVIDALATLCADALLIMPTARLFAGYWRAEAERVCDDADAQATSRSTVASAMDKLAEAAHSEANRGLRIPGTRWRHAAADVNRRSGRLRAQADGEASRPNTEMLLIGLVLVLGAVIALVFGIVATAQQAADTVHCLAEAVVSVL